MEFTKLENQPNSNGTEIVTPSVFDDFLSITKLVFNSDGTINPEMIKTLEPGDVFKMAITFLNADFKVKELFSSDDIKRFILICDNLLPDTDSAENNDSQLSVFSTIRNRLHPVLVLAKERELASEPAIDNDMRPADLYLDIIRPAFNSGNISREYISELSAERLYQAITKIINSSNYDIEHFSSLQIGQMSTVCNSFCEMHDTSGVFDEKISRLDHLFLQIKSNELLSVPSK